MFSTLYNSIVNLIPSGCKHIIIGEDRRCIDCGFQLPSEFQMDIYLNESDKPIGFVLINIKNTNLNLAEVKELIYDQVETVSANFRFTVKGVVISEKQENRFKAFDVYRANRDRLIIQNFFGNDSF